MIDAGSPAFLEQVFRFRSNAYFGTVPQYLARRTLSYKEVPNLVHHCTQNKQIPQVIFRTGPFSLNHMRRDVLGYLDDALKVNPEYTQIYFDDQDCLAFVKKEFPDYVTEYQSLIPGAYRADVWRLMILYKCGGVYCDLGHLFLKPLSTCIDVKDDDLVLVKDIGDWSIHNAFMCAKPGCAFLLDALKYIMGLVSTKQYSECFLSITGPVAVGHVFKQISQRGPLQYHVRMFQLERDAYYITSDKGESVIRTKFPGYYSIVYQGNGVAHYTELWRQRKVYR
jgi:mannosyltransferase OCH1-like enzyme